MNQIEQLHRYLCIATAWGFAVLLLWPPFAMLYNYTIVTWFMWVLIGATAATAITACSINLGCYKCCHPETIGEHSCKQGEP